MHENDRSLDGMRRWRARVRAGKLVWGRVWVHRDSLRVRAALFDAVDGATLREVTVDGPREQLVTRAGGMGGLAAELLRTGRPP